MTLQRAGWSLLSDIENARIWDRFTGAHHFRPSRAEDPWPGISEPTPSVTFDLKSLTVPGDRAQQTVDRAVVSAISADFAEVPEWYALDWNHHCYLFSPTIERENPSPLVDGDGFALPGVFPDGEYFVWATPDLGDGTFAHPWKQTLCIYGPRLVPLLESVLAAWMDIARVDGKPSGR